jgi:hypothetical protein
MLKDMQTECLLAVGKFPNTVSGLMQWALHSVEAWCDGHDLSVNPDMTGFVVLTQIRKLPGLFDPHLFGTTLRCSTMTKYLISKSDPGCTADLEGIRGC